MKRIKQRLAFVLAAALALMLLAGCGPQAPGVPSSSGGGEENGIVLTDQAGREVVLPESAGRVVSGAYLSTSVLLALGAEERVVGLEDQADTRTLYQMAAPALLELPAVSAANGTMDVEAAAALEPDLVILSAQQAAQAEAFDALEIPCIVLAPETLDDFWAAVTLLGAATGTEERAAALVQYQRGIMESVTTRCAETEERPSVYLAGPEFLSTAGSGMYQNVLIELCGGVNAAAEYTDAAWTEISLGELVSWDPDRIYMVSYAGYTRDDIMNDERFSALSAMEHHETDFLVFPSAIEPWDTLSPSMALGALWLGNQLHPDMIPQEEYVTEAQVFYRDFFGIEVGAELLLSHGG